jgi:hypothetical protein
LVQLFHDRVKMKALVSVVPNFRGVPVSAIQLRRLETQTGVGREMTQLTIGIQSEIAPLGAFGCTADLELQGHSVVANICQISCNSSNCKWFRPRVLYHLQVSLNFPVSVEFP